MAERKVLDITTLNADVHRHMDSIPTPPHVAHQFGDYLLFRLSTYIVRNTGHRTLGRYRLSLLPRTESVSPIPTFFSSGSFLIRFTLSQPYLLGGYQYTQFAAAH